MEKRRLINCIAYFTGLYLVQFVLIPKLFPKYFPESSNALAIYLVISIFACIAAVFCITSQMKYLFISDLWYAGMIVLFNTKGFYGIGRIGVGLDGLQTRISFAVMLITSLLIVVLLLVVQLICGQIVKRWKK